MTTEAKKTLCLACAAEFSGVDEQRVHYRSDWHRYNLQRQVAELPCVSEHDFNEKLQLQKAETNAEGSDAPSYRCDVCVKHFLSENVLRDHVTSKKHIVQLAKASKGAKGAKKGGHQAKPTGVKESLNASDKQVPVVDGKHGKQDDADQKKRKSESLDEEDSGSEAESWDSDAVGFEECLFCGSLSDTFEANCTHMERAHLFYIPDVAYCTDLEGLYTCIAERISLDHECLWCNRTLRSKRAAQQHMLAKQHCRLRYEDEYILDYSDYYDYEHVAGNAQVPQADSSSDSAGVRYTMTPAERDELLALLSSDDAFELVLPSGVTIGHRSLVRYYRQRLRDRDLPNANANRIHIGTGLVRSAISYRSNPSQSQQRSVLRADEVAALERRARDVMHLRRELQNRAAKLGVQANKLQRHFRKQML